MENKIYYTIEKQTQTIDTIEECNGYKNIQVYRIKNNQPKIWFQIEARNDEYSENERNEVVVFDKGGHTLDLDEPRFMSIIKNFIGSTPQ